ncbi:MAG TPA: UDP-N-acetylmuramoyl-tripeptide--D-alanyl-D-alanine ligase [Vicinamibacterales bacterium]|jgi:UDP-N-acetylmuramoyl-tripeptide--D-alanyl-D-alanine ligase
MRAANARLVAGNDGRTFDGVSIDTRTLKSDDLFVAIKGERFDGAEFAAAALERGAGGAIVPRGWSAGAGVAAAEVAERGSVIVEVDDTTLALQALAHAVRRDSGTKVVAITGSAGKTTTKEIAAELLAARYRVIRNRGNFNNHIGLPLSLIDLRARPEAAVVELGMNHSGEISTLVRIAEPDVRVWTNVGEAHLGFFASVDAIADAKAEILEDADAATVLVANADDARIVARIARFSGRTVTFGIDRAADVRATTVIDRGIEGTVAEVTTPHGRAELNVPLVGRANLSNVLAATAVALEFDVPLDTVAERVARLAPAPHRGEVVRLGNGATVIDDSYNANPTATKRALEVLSKAAGRRRIAVIGEMLELGEQSIGLHEDVGREVANQRIDLLFAVGGRPARALAESAVHAGMRSNAVQYVETSDAAASALLGLVQDGDVILVKGSRGIRTDRVVERLRTDRG